MECFVLQPCGVRVEGMLVYCIKNNIYDMLLFNAFEPPAMLTVYRYNSICVYLCSIYVAYVTYAFQILKQI